jgi:hypothetical protein
MQIELRDFKFSKVEVNEIYEDTMTDIEQDTVYIRRRRLDYIQYGQRNSIEFQLDDPI